MDSFVTAEKREIREEREHLGLDQPLSAPNVSPTPSSLPSVAAHSVTRLIPDPASYGDPSAWEHVRASPSPSPPPAAASSDSDTAAVSSDVQTVSGIGMFDKASERLRELGSSVGHKIEHFAASHKDFQKHNHTPNQHMPVVSDVEKEYYAAKDNEDKEIQREYDRQYEATMI